MPGQLRVEERGEARVLTLVNPARKGAVDPGMLASLTDEAARATRQKWWFVLRWAVGASPIRPPCLRETASTVESAATKGVKKQHAAFRGG